MKDINQLQRCYYFTNLEEIEKFLLKHDYLIEYLLQICDQVKRIFKKNLLEVDLEYDRDSEEDFEGLFVRIKTNLLPNLSLELLRKFDQWWLGINFKVRSVITIMTESKV
jgi:hypothetical protein